MDVCAQCGRELGLGRFCTSCGHRVGAEPTRAAPAPVAMAPLPEPAPGHRHVADRHPGAGAHWAPWVASLGAMLLAATTGLWLLLVDDDDRRAVTEPVSNDVATKQPATDPRKPQGRRTLDPLPAVPPGDLADVTAVRAPRPAPPTRDVSGNTVTYVAAHLLDGIAQTCWRTAGDGTGTTIGFTFDGPVEMSEVGLVNGYAKTASSADGTYDWYAGNRRTTRVEWTFDDGTVLTQGLAETRRMQTLPLDEEIVTERVTLRLVEVTPPGRGRASRDYTAISEVRLVGAPAT